MDPVTLKLSKNYTDEQLEPQRLKVATLDKSLSDFQHMLASVNVNQEAKQAVSGYGSVSLPKTAANGIAGAGMKGLTLQQILNYNPETWEDVMLVNTVVGDISGLEFTGMLNFNSTARLSNVNLKPTTKYLLLYSVLSNNLSNNFLIGSNVSGPIPNTVIPKNVGNNKVVLTTLSSFTMSYISLFTSAAEPTGNKIKLAPGIRLYECPPGSQIETDANNLTADQLAIKYPYIQGGSPKSTPCAGRFRGVGKNLFDEKRFLFSQGFINYNTGTVTTTGESASAFKYTPDYIPCEKMRGKNIVLNKTLGGSNPGMVFYDNDKNFISGFRTAGTVPVNAKYLRFTVGISAEYIQLEEGTTSTPYESYTESAQYFIATENGQIAEARSLPNGVRDTLDRKRIEKYVLKASDINAFTIRPEGANDVVTLNSFNSKLGIPPFNGSTQVNNNLRVSYYSEINSTSEVWNALPSGYYFAATTTTMWILFPKGTYVTLTEAREALAGIVIYYQLATEEIRAVQISGTLLSYPSGTVYFEKAVADAGIYSGSISVLHQDLPIKELERIAKIDFMTGLETELDVSKAVIATDRLSFTHPGLTKDDITAFNYFYDKEGTEGEMTVEFYDSRYVFEDTAVPGKFYKVVRTITNGVIVDTPVEV